MSNFPLSDLGFNLRDRIGGAAARAHLKYLARRQFIPTLN
jgi:hypothetical protein